MLGRRLIVIPALCGLLAGGLAAPAEPERRPPDILLIAADDMGYSDAGCFGGEIRTPGIDRLAARGLRFTQFYNSARCCPTRASLLTGQYAHRVGLARNGQSLSRDSITIAEALRAAGYQTGMVGKWHLSRTQPLADRARHQDWLDHRFDPGVPFAPIETYPTRRGFDRFYGVIWGVVDFFDPFSLVDGEEPVREVPPGFYFTDAITDRAVESVRAFSRSRKPFFLYLAHCAPHWPLHALPEDIERYRETYRGGWHALRQARYERQLAMGLADRTRTPLPPVMGQGPDWDALAPAEREFQAAKMAAHAAMVDRMDQGIQRVVRALEETGRFENTAIFFLSDNGASPEVPRAPGYDRSSRTRDGRPIRYEGFAAPGPQTTYTGIGSRWASAANTPFRYWKAESFEGGSRTPLVVQWPAGLKAKPGSLTDQPGHVIDLLPTCLDLAGAKAPAELRGRPVPPLDGRSLLPVLRGARREPHPALFFEHEGGRAIRAGDWKLVAPKAGGPWELYHLTQDQTETRDVARQHPEKARELETAWQGWFRSVSPPD